MTRINADFDVTRLLDQHLMAEYRELPMVYAALRRSLKKHDHRVQDLINVIPKKFTLNSGHVTFFYDKLDFLVKRYAKLIEELTYRGYSLDYDRHYDLSDLPSDLFNDWSMDSDAEGLIAARMYERYSAKPSWYRYLKDPIGDKSVRLLFGI